jgi:hypothetical protein
MSQQKYARFILHTKNVFKFHSGKFHTTHEWLTQWLEISCHPIKYFGGLHFYLDENNVQGPYSETCT